MIVSQEIKQQLIAWCENSKCRRVAIEFPHQWTPGLVVNPETGELKLGFSDASAWYYTAELIKNGCKIETIELDIPKGKCAFVILSLMPCGRHLYIKLMFGNGCILGRSFHYSEYTFSKVTN